jgi:uncharacterized membrane protein YphA (DoxX/SURF4 family)
MTQAQRRSSLAEYDTFYLRLALAAGFLTSITDRFGLWGPAGARNVAWGDLAHFFDYTAQLNPYVPAAAIPALGWFVTVAEATLAVMLLTGIRTRYAALASGWLLLAFALGMTVGTGVKSALNASVFAASGGAFVLARAGSYRWSMDALLAGKRRQNGQSG